jgi:glycerophosphoryl diester phosphodiesterase
MTIECPIAGRPTEPSVMDVCAGNEVEPASGVGEIIGHLAHTTRFPTTRQVLMTAGSSDIGSSVSGPSGVRHPLVIAHRGASAAAPENSLEAFHLAHQLGADWVELDAHLSADGDIVVTHDAHYASGILVRSVPAADRPGGVCLLSEALAVCDEVGLGINVEIKALPGDADAESAEELTDTVLALLDARYGSDAARRRSLLVTCFWPTTIKRVRAASDFATGWLTVDATSPAELAASVRSQGHQAINPWDPLITEEFISAAHAEGLAVNSWTVNEPDRMLQLANWGIDGIITDVPDVARSTLG